MELRENENLLRTKQYFDSWRSYQQEVGTDFVELYHNCGAAVDRELQGSVLDIGSGGIFNYRPALARTLVALDYSVDAIDRRGFPQHAVLVQGDGTRLPFRSESFDCVMMQFLVHHLAQRTHEQTTQDVTRCLQESLRVLRRGGKLLVVESCLPPVLEWLERSLYPFTRQLLKMVGQPMVFQFSVESLARTMQAQAQDPVVVVPISIGRSISQFGLKFPGWLSPCQIRLFKAVKRGS